MLASCLTGGPEAGMAVSIQKMMGRSGNSGNGYNRKAAWKS